MEFAVWPGTEGQQTRDRQAGTGFAVGSRYLKEQKGCPRIGFRRKGQEVRDIGL